MNIKELHPTLQKAYKADLDCGLVKTKDSKNPNIYFVVPPTPPVEMMSHFPIKKISEALSTLRKIPSYGEMDDLDKLINYLFVRREAVQSSRMEGTWSTIDEVLSLPSLTEGHDSEATLSVRGYATALEHIFDKTYKQKENIFTMQTICQIHKAIAEKDKSFLGLPGQIRTPGKVGSVVYVGGGGRPEDSIYNPAPPEFVKSSLEKILAWFSSEEIAQRGDAGIGLSLPLRIAIGHAHFEAVHPFTDGNGRVGRALWPLQMISSDIMPLYLSGYVEKEKLAYGKALELAQKKLNYHEIVEFICEAIISSEYEMKITKNKLLSLPALWRERGEFRQKSSADHALPIILKSPIFNLASLQNELQCSHQAAAHAIHQLEEKNIIKERTGNKRNRLFAAEEVIYLLARSHGSDADLALDKAMRTLKA